MEMKTLVLALPLLLTLLGDSLPLTLLLLTLMPFSSESPSDPVKPEAGRQALNEYVGLVRNS
jgi:hypothetical protein